MHVLKEEVPLMVKSLGGGGVFQYYTLDLKLVINFVVLNVLIS